MAENKVRLKLLACRMFFIIISLSLVLGNAGFQADTQGVVQGAEEVLPERKEACRQRIAQLPSRPGRHRSR